MSTVERCPACGAIKCPYCGAPVKEGITNCPYCNVEFRISDDGQSFTKIEHLVCPQCGAKVTRADPLCPSCKKKAWQYCPNLECHDKFDLDMETCPTCGMNVTEGLAELQTSTEHLREKAGAKVSSTLDQLDPQEHVLVLLDAVEDTLIITDTRLLHLSGKTTYSYPFSQIEDASLDKFGNLIISMGGEKPREILIICPKAKEKLFQGAVDLLLKYRDKAQV